MGFSSLISGTALADSSNYTHGRLGYKICKFTPHHMSGRLTAKRCCELFQNPSRNASANYTIGYDGEIYGCVPEECRAWTSSSRTNDCQAITVEVANSSIGGDWPISEASWNALINLAEDVCRRYNFRLVYDDTPNGSLTKHKMFSKTDCPGPYLESRLPELARIVNDRLDGKNSTPAAAAQITIQDSIAREDGRLVTVTTDVLNIRSGPSTAYGINGQIKDRGTYTIVEEVNGWGRLKSGAGWICLQYTSANGGKTPTPANKYELGLYVVNASALNVRSGAGTNYKIKKTYSRGTRFDTYEIRGDWARTPSGWVNLNYCNLVRKY